MTRKAKLPKVTKAMKEIGILEIICKNEDWGDTRYESYYAVIDPALVPSSVTTLASYGRPIKVKNVSRMEEDFLGIAVGVPLCNLRNGKVRTADGNHRISLANRRNVRRINATLTIDLVLKVEAEMFAKTNGGRQRMDAWQQFRANLASGVHRESHIINSVNDVGLTLPEPLTPGIDHHPDLKSTKSLYQAFDKNVLDKFLYVLKKYFYEEEQLEGSARHSVFQTALVKFIATDCSEKTKTQIVKLFKESNCNSCDIVAIAKSLSEKGKRGPRSEAVYHEAMVQACGMRKPKAKAKPVRGRQTKSARATKKQLAPTSAV